MIGFLLEVVVLAFLCHAYLKVGRRRYERELQEQYPSVLAADDLTVKQLNALLDGGIVVVGTPLQYPMLVGYYRVSEVTGFASKDVDGVWKEYASTKEARTEIEVAKTARSVAEELRKRGAA